MSNIEFDCAFCDEGVRTINGKESHCFECDGDGFVVRFIPGWHTNERQPAMARERQ